MKDTASCKSEYTKHNNSQRQYILSEAEKLFIEKGIDAVPFSGIADRCGIMRATLYRYFKNKEELLWAIFNSYFSSAFQPLFEMNGTTLERFEKYLDLAVSLYHTAPQSWLFFDVFFREYQEITTDSSMEKYDALNHEKFGTGDTVRFLTLNFHDGSVRDDLPPVTTAVSFAYGVISIILLAAKAEKSFQHKYQVDSESFIRMNTQALLRNICAKQKSDET